jgi:hypothetical protein
VRRASRTTSAANSSRRTACIRTRGVITSAAVREPKSSERVSSAAVDSPSVPTCAERRTSAASSSGVLALDSSSCGSTPKACSTRFALPLSTRMSGPAPVVKARCGPATSRAVASGAEIPRFCGRSSPKIIENAVATSRATASDTPGSAEAGTPARLSGPSSGPSSSAPRDGLHQVPHHQRGERDPHLCAGELGRQALDGDHHALRAAVTGVSGPLDARSVDRDQGELGGHEDRRPDGEQHAQPEQQPGVTTAPGGGRP